MTETTRYLLRTVNARHQSHGGFQWPTTPGARVEPERWDPSPGCGNGIHGLLNGEGDGSLLNWEPGAVWQIVSTTADVIELGGKVKTPWVELVAHGGQTAITAHLATLCPGRAIVGLSATAGDSGTATAGYYGTATAGYYGTATVGYYGTATAGYYGTATAGDYGTATAGDYGTATAGDYGTATAGDRGTATAGDSGTATAGYYGTATAGDSGTATAGYYGTATAGDRGTLCIFWFDGTRRRLTVGYVGENGIKPNTPYRCGAVGRLVEVTP